MAQTQAVTVFTPQELNLALREQAPIIAALLAGSPIKPNKLVASVLVEVDKNPALAKCSLKSVIGSAVEIAKLGLEIGGTLGEAYIVPFNKRKCIDGQWVDDPQASPIVGYKGFVGLVHRSGFVRSIDAHCVYENDAFDFGLGSEPWVKFRPALKGPRGEVLCFFAVATMADGTKKVEVMTVDQVNTIRDKAIAVARAAARKKGKSEDDIDTPWTTHYAEMGRKTAIRRITKQLPKTAALIRAEQIEDQADAGEPVDAGQVLDVEAEVVEVGSSDPAAGPITIIRPDGSVVNTETGEVSRPWQMTEDLWGQLLVDAKQAGVALNEAAEALGVGPLPNPRRNVTQPQYDALRARVDQVLARQADAPF